MPVRSKNKRANPFMASSDLPPAAFEKLLDAFVLLEPVRGAAQRAGVTNKTAERFIALLMDRMQVTGLLDVTLEVPSHVWDSGELNKWINQNLASHRGFKDPEIETMHRVRYTWIFIMVHIHKPLLVSYEGEESLRLALKAIRQPIREMIKLTGPLNRPPHAMALEKCCRKFYRDMTRRLENRKYA